MKILKNKFFILMMSVITLTALFAIPTASRGIKANSIIGKDEPKVSMNNEDDKSFKNFNMEDLIFPNGIETREGLIKYSIEKGLLREDYSEDPLKISEYVKVLNNILYNNNRLLKYGKLIVKDNLPQEERHIKEYVDLAFDGYLAAFTEEEIDNDDVVSMNHFTRTLSSILENFVEKDDYSEDNLKLLINEYEDYFNGDTPECRVKKTIHLMQNGMLPLNYNNEITYDKALKEIDVANMLLKMEDKIEFMESDYDKKDCKPCWEEEAGYEVRGR